MGHTGARTVAQEGSGRVHGVIHRALGEKCTLVVAKTLPALGDHRLLGRL